ncbi:MAG: hypothetical protein ACRDFB_05560 [Rhabdochlamydiaceae bacterium]
MSNLKQYHGYLALPRHAKLLREELGYNLYSLYEALVMDAIWHRNNPRIGCVIGTQAEIAKSLHISQSSLSRGLESLQGKSTKYVIRHKGYIVLGYFPLFLTDVVSKMHSKDYATLQELYADMYRINAELQEIYAISQVKRYQNTRQRLYSSSNSNLDSSNEVIRIEDIPEDLGKPSEE